MCVLNVSGGIGRRILIKKVRTKSVVLSEPLKKGDVAMIAYQRWAYGRVEEQNGNTIVFVEGYDK